MKEKRIPFSNTYMFGRVMRDEAICQGFIETVLGVRVERITYTNAEQVLEPVPDGKGVRLDLYVEADGGAFDLEMQSYGEKALGRRFRYYQSAIDARCLDKGDDYDMLPEAYVVFLCTHDPFGLGLPTYRLERMHGGSHLQRSLRISLACVELVCLWFFAKRSTTTPVRIC